MPKANDREVLDNVEKLCEQGKKVSENRIKKEIRAVVSIVDF